VIQTSLQALLIDRMKYNQTKYEKSLSKNKIQIPHYDFFATIFFSIFTSAICFLATYPFDLAYGRTTTCLGNKSFANFGHTFIRKSGEPFILKYYNGASYAAMNTIVYSAITFTGYQILYTSANVTNNNTLFTFLCTSMISLLASIVAYPYDTAKRRYQLLSIVDENIAESIVNKAKYK
jgi:hypothetical protein